MAHRVWIDENIVLAIHEEQLAEHGGAVGIRDRGLLESALARARNLKAYEAAGKVDAARLAAAYAFGLVRNRPFVDGNKRTGFVLMELFLELNGVELRASDEDCVTTILELAAGTLTEAQLTNWIRLRLENQ